MTFWKWSKTAASNSNADSTINWAEGQAPSSVNDSARALMAAAAKYRDDVSGMLNTGGSSTAYTITTNQVLTALTDGFKATVRFHATNGTDPTVAVDSLTAKNICTHTSGGTPVNLTSGAARIGGIYTLTYDSGDDVFYIHDVFDITVTDYADNLFRISDNGDATKKVAFELSGVTTGNTRTLTVPDASGTILISTNIGVTVQAFDADTLKSNVTASLTKGYTSPSIDNGTKSSGTFTPAFADGQIQHYVNGGAHTLAPPNSGHGHITMDITNNSSAGAITTSGFTMVVGDSFTTTNAHKFRCSISVGNGGSLLNITALQ